MHYREKLLRVMETQQIILKDECIYLPNIFILLTKNALRLPWWKVDKNPPVNAGDTGSIPGPGRFLMPQSN